MDAIMLAVINMSLTASIVILGVFIARLLLKRAPKIISYILWIVVAFRLIVPFSFESNFSLMPTKAEPIPQDIVYQEAPRIDTGITGVDDFVSDMLPSSAQNMNGGYIYSDSSDAGIIASNPLQTYFSVAALIWIIGIMCMMAYSLISMYLLKRRVCEATLLHDNIYETQNIKTPFVIGFIKPKIYLPTGLAENEKEYIILHEQTHINRFDHIIKLVAFFVLCIHWFNPLVWVAFVLMSADMELSCDEKVLEKLGDGIKKDYSYSLLSLSTGRRIINGSPLAFGEGGIKARIKNILKFKKSSRIVVVVGVVVAAILITGFAGNRAGESPNDIYKHYLNAANEVNNSTNRSYNLHSYTEITTPGQTTSEQADVEVVTMETTEYYEVNMALSKDYRYYRNVENTFLGDSTNSNCFYIDGVWYANAKGIYNEENIEEKIKQNGDPIYWKPQIIFPIGRNIFDTAKVEQVGDDTKLQLTVEGRTAAKHIWRTAGIIPDQYDCDDATVTTMIDKNGRIIEQQIDWSYSDTIESGITKYYYKETISNISIEDFEIDFPKDLDDYESVDSFAYRGYSFVSDLKDLKDSGYDSDLTFAALQEYIKNDIGRNYSKDIIVRRVLYTYISENGSLYLLIQLPNISEGQVVPGGDFVRIVAVEKNNEYEYNATTISRGAKAEPIEGPYVQFNIPFIDEGLHFVITYIVDYEYKVFFNGEQLALNDDGMVAVVIASDTEPTIEQWPVVSRMDTFPEYPRNASGQTYGDGSHIQQIGPPDLIAVEGQDGTEGYVYYVEMIGKEATSPEEALEWMENENYRKPRAINIYESDGKTKIGEFVAGARS